MPGQTFADGFPISALEAIDASYFLTDQEKADWRVWLNTAGEEQKQELVNTLHEIWLSQQKQTIPQGFASNTVEAAPPEAFNSQPAYNNFASNSNSVDSDNHANNEFNNFSNNNFQQSNSRTQGQDPVYQQPNNDFSNYNFAPVPVTNSDNSFVQQTNNSYNAAQNSTTNNFADNPDQNQPTSFGPQTTSTQSFAPAIQTTQQNQELDHDENDMSNFGSYNDNSQQQEQSKQPSEESFLNLTKNRYTPNPILEDRSPTPSEFVYTNNQNQTESVYPVEKLKNNSFAPISNNLSSEKTPTEDKKESQKERKSVSFGPSEEMKSMYQMFLDTQKRNSTLEQEVQQKQKELQEKQVQFLEKMMQMVARVEDTNEKIEGTNNKIDKLSGILVTQTKDIDNLKTGTQARSGISLQEQINTVRYDLEKLIREFSDFRTDLSRKYQKLSEDASVGAIYQSIDLYKKFETLEGRTAKLEEGLKYTPKLSKVSNNGQTKDNIQN